MKTVLEIMVGLIIMALLAPFTAALLLFQTAHRPPSVMD